MRWVISKEMFGISKEERKTTGSEDCSYGIVDALEFSLRISHSERARYSYPFHASHQKLSSHSELQGINPIPTPQRLYTPPHFDPSILTTPTP